MFAYDCIERDGAAATAVLLHPHPDYGGDRYHPVIDALYRGLPVSTLRFDFGSSDFEAAHAETREAIGLAPSSSVVLIGYSFGASVALGVDDPAVLGWFVVAPRSGGPPGPTPRRVATPARSMCSSPSSTSTRPPA